MNSFRSLIAPQALALALVWHQSVARAETAVAGAVAAAMPAAGVLPTPVDAVASARALVARVLPGRADDFDFAIIPAAGDRDVFEYEAGAGGRPVLRGNNAGSLAMAFNTYLRTEMRVDYDWQADGPLRLDGALRAPRARVRRECLARERFFLNYCTFGYTFPFTGWAGWERFVDWMAMNGINRPLLQTGQEAAWYEVWKSYGLSDAQIRGYFSGPAHLGWHRMANLDGWGGPLPMSYISSQAALQKKIVGRARELGMKPILSAFGGHVPEALKAARPAAAITRIKPGWGGLSSKYACYFLAPEDPLFAEVQRRFLAAQNALYGNDHLYAADPFNEISPPSWSPDYLGSVAKAIYGGLQAADPAAVWYQMSWNFYFDNRWNRRDANGATPLSAMVAAVPTGRLVFLDYVCERVEFYKKSQAFFGAPFVWNYLGNFGGNIYLIAPLRPMAANIGSALKVPNCIGVGATLEGIGANGFSFDLVLEAPWLPGGVPEVDVWLKDYAARRAGREDPAVAKAWTFVTAPAVLSRSDRGSSLTQRPSFNVKRDASAPKTAQAGDTVARSREAMVALRSAMDALLAAKPESFAADGVRFDLVNVLRQALAYHSDNLRARMMDAYRVKDADKFRSVSGELLDVIRDMDTLVGTRHEFLLGRWIRDARAIGVDEAEAAYYEKNARQILTTWHAAGGGLTDYARREWNGLLATYYLPRWSEFVRRLNLSLRENKPFDPGDYDRWRVTFEGDWVNATGGHFATEPAGDPVDTARRIFQKYRDRF